MPDFPLRAGIWSDLACTDFVHSVTDVVSSYVHIYGFQCHAIPEAIVVLSYRHWSPVVRMGKKNVSLPLTPQTFMRPGKDRGKYHGLLPWSRRKLPFPGHTALPPGLVMLALHSSCVVK